MDEERKRFIDVLDTFMERCPNPTPRQVEAWTKAYPQYEEHFKRTAADALAINRITGGRSGRAPSEAEVDAEFAKAALAAGPEAPTATLAEVIDGAGQDLPSIARSLDIGVDILVSLEEGRCVSAPPETFIEALANVVALPRGRVRSAIESSRRDADLSLAASMATKVDAAGRTWDQLLEASDMSQTRKDFWRAAASDAR